MHTKTTSSCIALLVVFAASLLADDPQIQPDAKLVTVANDHVRIGIDLNVGGAIAWLSDAKREPKRNLVNVHDPGRYIQQSYYAGPKPFGEPHPAWKDWPWNPIGAGDVYGNKATVLAHRSDDNANTLYVKTRPMQWALDNVPGDCTFETWIKLDGPVAHVRCRLTNARKDKTVYPARHQELPAVYPIAALGKLVTYNGDRPFTGARVSEIKGPGNPWTGFGATEHWAACIDNTNRGVGVIHPGVERFLGGYHRPAGVEGNGAMSDPTGYIAPIRSVAIKHDTVFEYEYQLVLGTLKEIRARVYRDHEQRDDDEQLGRPAACRTIPPCKRSSPNAAI